MSEMEMTPETIKTLAEAEAYRADARKAAAETRKLEAEAVAAEIDARRAQRHEDAELSKDEHHRVFRFVGAVSGATVSSCVAKLTEWHRLDPGCHIEIVFYSPGGSILDGFVLFDFVRELSRSGHRITTGCLGMAASMAGILLQMGDHRWMGKESWVMIHRASFSAGGQTFQVEDEVEWVKRVEKRILNIFVERSGGRLTGEKIRRNWDRKDWWLTSDEALNLGVVDEVR
jgi:ATP-dependent Clp protease protease subunit